MRSIVLAGVVVSALALVNPVSAQSGDPYFETAERTFQSFDVNTRLFMQALLTSAGFWSNVPNVTYSRRLHEAVKQFQGSRGQAATGVLTNAQVTLLADAGGPIWKTWGFRTVRHPTRGRSLFVPMGLDLRADKTDFGVVIAEPKNRLKIKFNYFPDLALRSSYEVMLNEMTKSGDAIDYKIVRSDFFVVVGSQGRYKRYVRYHADGAGLLGFDMSWSEDGAPVYGDRLVNVVSGSFWASMNNAPFVSARPILYPWEDASVATLPAPAPQVPIVPAATPQPPQRQETKVYTGSGFFVTAGGYVVTNNHVVETCTSPIVKTDDGSTDVSARIIARDKKNDLALVKTNLTARRTAPIMIGVRLGEPVAVFGFPHADVLAKTGNFTQGSVSALAGMGDDTTMLQITAPVQSGNSGGPLLDYRGNLVGVVKAKLNAVRTAELTGDMPQNVNFAIKSATVVSFLDTAGVSYETGSKAGDTLAAPDLADVAKRLSVFIICK